MQDIPPTWVDVVWLIFIIICIGVIVYDVT